MGVQQPLAKSPLVLNTLPRRSCGLAVSFQAVSPRHRELPHLALALALYNMKESPWFLAWFCVSPSNARPYFGPASMPPLCLAQCRQPARAGTAAGAGLAAGWAATDPKFSHTETPCGHNGRQAGMS